MHKIFQISPFIKRQSRHENSILDLQDLDLDVKLSTIQCPNGHVSTEFPRTLNELLSYDCTWYLPVVDFKMFVYKPRGEKLTKLLKEYHLLPLKQHTENLNRFLAFVGKFQSAANKLCMMIRIGLTQDPGLVSRSKCDNS